MAEATSGEALGMVLQPEVSACKQVGTKVSRERGAGGKTKIGAHRSEKKLVEPSPAPQFKPKKDIIFGFLDSVRGTL